MPIDMALYMRNRRRERRASMVARLGGVCVVCGSSSDLQLDHIDPSKKAFNCSSAYALDGPLDRLEAEVDKCQLLCAPHHQEKSRLNGELGGGQNRVVNPAHGTAVMYNAPNRCRCSECREWKRKYRANLVDARGQPCK